MHTQRDWLAWHRDYDEPGSLLSRRLELVQGHLHAELEHAPAGGIRLISLCAGQGRDVIGVLAGHPRRCAPGWSNWTSAMSRARGRQRRRLGWRASNCCKPTPGSPMPASARSPPR